MVSTDVVFQKGDAENVNHRGEDLTNHHRNMESMNLKGKDKKICLALLLRYFMGNVFYLRVDIQELNENKRGECDCDEAEKCSLEHCHCHQHYDRTLERELRN